MPWSFERISEMPLLEISSSLAIADWLILLSIFTIFLLISLEMFTMILDIRIFIIFKKQSVLFQKIFGCLLWNIFVLKCCILIGLYEVAKNFKWLFLRIVFLSHSVIQNLFYKNIWFSIGMTPWGPMFYL